MEVYKVKFLYGKLYKKYFPIKSTSIFYEMEKKGVRYFNKMDQEY